MKKILCIILAISMITACIPVMAATKTFSDVAETNRYKNAIYTLADFGIIKGDAGADTFRPEANISREEFSVIMTRVLGLSNLNVSVTEYPFVDVTPATCADWSIQATKIAYDLGIIAGFGNGEFKPKEKVTYEQAVKMIVCTLGYNDAAVSLGGWPNGYIITARNLGVLANAEAAQTEPASRQIIAQLVANSLEVPLADTLVDENRTLLTEKLQYKEATGVVTGIKGTALKSSGTAIDEDEVQIDHKLTFKIGETSAKDYFGKSITYYYKTDVDSILVSARLTSKNSEVTLHSDEIKSLSSKKLDYYPDPEDTSEYETYYFESDVAAIYNSKYISEISKDHLPDSGSIKLIDNNGNGSYDVVIIDSTEVYLVSAVDTSKKLVYNTYDQSQVLDLNEAGGQRDVTITKNGAEVDFSQIAKGNVLIVSRSMSPSGKQAYNVEIVTAKATGTVSEVSALGDEVVISGKTYEFSSAYNRYIQANPSKAMSLSDKVTVYLDSNNKILAATVTSVAATARYGYLIATGARDKDEYAQFKIYTTDNKTVTLKGADKVKINGKSYTYDEVEDVLANSNSATNKDDGVTNGEMAQLIKYTTNSSGKIDTIHTLQTSGDSDETLVLSKAYQSATYKSGSKSFKDIGITLSASTKVMFIPTDRKDTSSYSVGTYSKLVSDKSYNIEAYDASSTGVPTIILVYDAPNPITLNDVGVTFALVDSIKTVANGDEVVTQLSCIVNGASATYSCEDASKLEAYSKGDVLKLAFDTKGYITDVEAAFDIDNIPSQGKSNRYKEKSDSSTGSSYYTVYGTVYARDDSIATITPYDVAEDGTLVDTPTFTAPSLENAKVHILDVTGNSPKLTEGSINSIAGYESSMSGASTVFAYVRDAKTRLFLVIIK